MKQHYINKFADLLFREKLLFFEALFSQYAVWLLLLVVPFRKIPGIFPNPQNPADNPDREILRHIKQATGYANILSFWKNKCLVQSLSARRMLQRRGIASQLSLGVKHTDNQRLTAHAWLKAGDMEVVEKTGPYKELFNF